MAKIVTLIVSHLKGIKNNTARRKDEMTELLPNVYQKHHLKHVDNRRRSMTTEEEEEEEEEGGGGGGTATCLDQFYLPVCQSDLVVIAFYTKNNIELELELEEKAEEKEQEEEGAAAAAQEYQEEEDGEGGRIEEKKKKQMEEAEEQKKKKNKNRNKKNNKKMFLFYSERNSLRTEISIRRITTYVTRILI